MWKFPDRTLELLSQTIFGAVESTDAAKYLHCGGCGTVISIIPKSHAGMEFDLYDCGWPCGQCGRVNLSGDDGNQDRYDSQGGCHTIFVRNNEEAQRIGRLRGGFNFPGGRINLLDL